MSDNHEIVPGEVVNEQLELSDEQIADFIDAGGEVPKYHTILEVWREVLSPARDEVNVKVGPKWANTIVASYPQINYADMNDYRDIYFGKLIEILDIVIAEIETDEDCLGYTDPQSDAAENEVHYQNLILTWNLAIQQWELDWDCTSEHAALEIAAISEVHKMVFGPTGITQYLDNIGFQFTEDDQQLLADALVEARGGRE